MPKPNIILSSKPSPNTHNAKCVLETNTIHTLTHWGRVMHTCVSKLIIIGSDNGLSPGRCQAIIWTNAGILLFEPLGTNFSEILIEIHTFSFKKMHLKMSSGKWQPFCLGLNCFNTLSPNDVSMHQWTESLLVQRMATHFFKQWWFLVNSTLSNNFQWNNEKVSVKKMHLKKLSAKWHPFCSGLHVLTLQGHTLTG